MIYQLENNNNDKTTINVKTGSIDKTSESAVSYLLTYLLNSQEPKCSQSFYGLQLWHQTNNKKSNKFQD